MANKYYCIIKKEDCFYVPIKAHDNPYYKPGKSWINPISYLACRPNFFGGKMEREDSGMIEKCLAREVKEESQQLIEINSGDGVTVEKIFPAGERTEDYNFYLVTVNGAGEYFSGSCCVLDMGRGKRDNEKEMSCILKISKGGLAGKDLDGFLTVCKNLGGEKVDLDLPSSIDDWNDRGSKDAFQALLDKINAE